MKFTSKALEAAASVVKQSAPRPEDAPEYIEIMQLVRMANESLAVAEISQTAARDATLKAARMREELMMRAVLIKEKLGMLCNPDNPDHICEKCCDHTDSDDHNCLDCGKVMIYGR